MEHIDRTSCQQQNHHLNGELFKILPVEFGWYLVIFIFSWLTFACIGITWRFLKIKCGSRVKPDGKRAILITGATSGIGLAIAKHFYKLGFTVIAAYYNDQEPGYNELLELGKLPYTSVSKRISSKPKMFLVRMDVRSKESIADSSKRVHELLDAQDIKLYCLINNAGISKDGPFEWCCRESIDDILDTNLRGVMLVTREYISDIITNRGRVVNVSSGVFLTPIVTLSTYGSCKSAVAYFSASIDQDIRLYGASSVCVMPGNFISNSNIMYPRIKCLQESMKKLSDNEKNLYQKSLKFHSKLLDRQLKNKLAMSGDDPNHVATFYKLDVPELSKSKRRPSYIRGLLRWLARQVDGSVARKIPLESSGLTVGFEDAVCLKHPPQTLFAGNYVYSFITGPSIDYWPRALYGVLTWLALRMVKDQ